MVGIPFINTIINPGAKDYKSVYIEDKNQYYISPTLNPTVLAQVAEQSMASDNSLLPFASPEEDDSLTIPETFAYKQSPNGGSDLLDIYFALLVFTMSKSSQKFTYTQTYMKIDTLIAYVGGLIGSIISIFFVMNAFSGTAFLISAAQKVFRYNK